MLIDARTAVLDNDFINHLVECRMDNDRLFSILRTAFERLNLTAVVHPLVFEKEVLQSDKRIAALFAEQILRKAEFDDIFQGNREKKKYYIYLIKQLYYGLKNQHFPVSDDQVLTYWVRRNSFGEIHSITTCLVCQSAMFLSDDKDSKTIQAYAMRKSLGCVNVLNRNDFFEKYISEGNTDISKKERRSLTHV